MCVRQKSMNCRLIAAVGLVVVGLMSLMSLNLLWPMIILGPGLIMLSLALFGGRTGAAVFSIPGMLVSGLGGLLFIQNVTGYWESWAYAWTLFGVFLGMGLTLMGQRLDDRSLQSVGNWFVYGGFFAFAAFAFFFELIIGISGFGGTLGAVVLIGLGLLLLSRGGGLSAFLTMLSGERPKTKRKTKKAKRAEDKLFTGPVVYGSRAAARGTNRLSVGEATSSSEREVNP